MYLAQVAGKLLKLKTWWTNWAKSNVKVSNCCVTYYLKKYKLVYSMAVTLAVTTVSPAVVGCHRGCLLPPVVVHVTSHTL